MAKIDTKRPVIYADKEAKIIHTFENGNLAVVVDGFLEVLTFTPEGVPVNKDGAYYLANRPEEYFLNVYPNTPEICRHPTQKSALIGRSLGGNPENLGKDSFTVKVTIVDGVKKFEIV